MLLRFVPILVAILTAGVLILALGRTLRALAREPRD